MNPAEKEVIKKISSHFLRLKKRKKLTSQDETKLVKDISGLLGIYALDKSELLEKQIESMIDFAKKQRWGIEGSIIEFKRIKQGRLKVKLK